MNNILIIIPARFASTRLPAKPLMKICGKEMIVRVAEIADFVCKKTENCSYIVATDNDKIESFCDKNKIPVLITSEDCKSGTERCWNAVEKRNEKPDFIINLQGDNPLCPPWFLENLIESWSKDKNLSPLQVFTPYLHLSWEDYDRFIESKKTTPFSGTSVIFDKNNNALAFSKAVIPNIRNEAKLRQTLDKSPICRHIGLYAYTYTALKAYFEIEHSPYEEPEGLEQMRFLHNNIPIKMIKVDYKGRKSMSGIDSPEDIVRAENIIKEYGEFILTI